MEYNIEFTKRNLKTNIKKSICMMTFILSSRKFIISSFVSSLFDVYSFLNIFFLHYQIYKKKFENLGLLLYSFEKEFFNPKALLMRFNRNTPNVSYLFAIIAYGFYDFSLSVLFYEMNYKYEGCYF